jgi:hypothetical protein
MFNEHTRSFAELQRLRDSHCIVSYLIHSSWMAKSPNTDRARISVYTCALTHQAMGSDGNSYCLLCLSEPFGADRGMASHSQRAHLRFHLTFSKYHYAIECVATQDSMLFHVHTKPSQQQLSPIHMKAIQIGSFHG